MSGSTNASQVILQAWTADAPFSHRGTYWQFDNIVVEPPTAQRPHPPIWMGAGSERSIRRVAAQGYNLLFGQYASPADVASNIAIYKSEVEARGHKFDPMQVAVTRAFFVCDSAAEREAAMERRLANRVRQLKLATRPDGTVHGGPDRATGDPQAVNEASAMYGSPDHIAERLEELRAAGAGYVLINGGGSGGGARGRDQSAPFRPRGHAALRRGDGQARCGVVRPPRIPDRRAYRLPDLLFRRCRRQTLTVSLTDHPNLKAGLRAADAGNSGNRRG